jgi:CRISPR/Cas system endoribonuclease Cas6 (RAMP superfamily)
VRFVTPTELKTAGGIATRPEFEVLASRVRDRVSTLSGLYGSGPLDMDFAAFGERACKVEITRCDLRMVNAARRSGRTGQVHSLGGFVGDVEYTGDLAEFLPLLQAAEWTGVGRQTTWGKGTIEVVAP